MVPGSISCIFQANSEKTRVQIRCQKISVNRSNGQRLEYGFKGVVVNILVYIEGCENVERVAEVYLSRNNCVASEDGEKVCSADDGVHIDNGHDAICVAIEIGLYNPHTVVGVGVVEGFAEMMDKRT